MGIKTPRGLTLAATTQQAPKPPSLTARMTIRPSRNQERHLRVLGSKFVWDCTPSCGSCKYVVTTSTGWLPESCPRSIVCFVDARNRQADCRNGIRQDRHLTNPHAHNLLAIKAVALKTHIHNLAIDARHASAGHVTCRNQEDPRMALISTGLLCLAGFS